MNYLVQDKIDLSLEQAQTVINGYCVDPSVLVAPEPEYSSVVETWTFPNGVIRSFSGRGGKT